MRTNINILFFALAITLFACKSKKAEEPVNPNILSDTMIAKAAFDTVVIETVNSSLKLYGKITADNNKLSQVFPVVGGYVSKVNVELGDYVKQGQVLAVMRSEEVAGYENQRLDAVNDIAIAEKNLQVARDLFEGKLSSEKEVVAAEKELEKSKAALQRIKEVYSIYGLSKGSMYNVSSPISGFIIEKNVTPNMLLHSENVSNLFSVAQINEVWVMANVNESDIAAIQQGMTANIKTISYPDRVFTGKVDKIFNMLDPETKTMKVRIRIANEDLALKPEMSVTVSLQYKENKEMLAVPSRAIIFDKSKTWVLVYRNRNDIEIREVRIYKQTDETTYIKSGLEPNEIIVTQNQLLIYTALGG